MSGWGCKPYANFGSRFTFSTFNVSFQRELVPPNHLHLRWIVAEIQKQKPSTIAGYVQILRIDFHNCKFLRWLLKKHEKTIEILLGFHQPIIPTFHPFRFRTTRLGTVGEPGRSRRPCLHGIATLFSRGVGHLKWWWFLRKRPTPKNPPNLRNSSSLTRFLGVKPDVLVFFWGDAYNIPMWAIKTPLVVQEL